VFADTVATLLEFRNKLPLVAARTDERMTTVVEKMNSYDISQLPVVDDFDRLVGMVSEVDLLDHLLHADHIHDPEETIAAVINPNVLTVEPNSSLESVFSAFERGKVAVITEEGRPVNLLTKIDLIDYLAEKIG
jgi:cystathionine beta-synthase